MHLLDLFKIQFNTKMKKVALIIIAIGDPYHELKLKILATNVMKVRAIPDTHVTIHLNQYTDNPELTAAIQAIDPNIIINHSPGYLFQLLYKFNKPDLYQDFDHIILTLDDVEITNLDFPGLFNEQSDFNLDILSPKVIGGHHSHMRSTNTTDLCLATFIEFFFYIFTPSAYQKWFNAIKPDSSTLWGYDLLLFYLNNLRCAIDYRYTVTHHLNATSNTDNGYAEVNDLIASLDINIWYFANTMIPLLDCEQSTLSETGTQSAPSEQGEQSTPSVPSVPSEGEQSTLSEKADTNRCHYIKSAYFGSKNVTDIVRKLYDDGCRVFEASNQIFGDHNPNYYKFLGINLGGAKQLFAIEKSACKNLPHHTHLITLD